MERMKENWGYPYFGVFGSGQGKQQVAGYVRLDRIILAVSIVLSRPPILLFLVSVPFQAISYTLVSSFRCD
jgi:hypothetical protein